MDIEFDVLMKKGIWDLVTSDGANIVIDCKWAYRIKRNARWKLR